MAAYYPEAPSAAQQRHAQGFVAGLAQLYPCTHCAGDFQEAVAASPPAVGSRAAFSKWACEQHNTVNEKLGKPAFPCAMETLMARWRTGSAHCFPAQGKETGEESLGQDSL
jgi:mitochondrial FAD-linked sulfhydryl oxidase